jgi:hypothetical protein
VALCSAHLVNAQTREQAQAIRQGTNTPALEALAAEFQRKFDADEAAVARYLAANPGVQREVVKDGVPHRIVRIGADGNPIYIKSKAGRETARSNVESGALIKADSLYPGGSLGVDITGQGMTVGVWEPGVPRATHELLTGKVTIQANQQGDTGISAQNHATHVTGTIVGRSGLLGNGASARGLAYSASANNWDSTNDTTEMAGAAGNSLLVSNHSYGYANDDTIPVWQFGAYDNESRSWDLLTAAAPFYLPFVAGGNEQQASGNMGKAGYDLMTGASASKNAMTVGAVNADKSMSDFSNWGPTDDGRIKPEVVARGTGINSAQATSDTAYSGSGTDSSGTSYATPAVTAAAALLQQYHASRNGGTYMRASTLKTLLMGTAEDLGQPGPDHKFGYGLVNVEAAANAIKNNSTVTGTNCAAGTATGTSCAVSAANSRGALVYEWLSNPTNNSSDEVVMTVTAKGNGTPLVVNLGWTDDAGTEQVAGDGTDPTTSRMVYDFDVSVRTPANAFERPWVLPGMANRADNATKATAYFASNGGPFRQVVIANPAAGNHVIYIRKKIDSPATMRPMSLVVTGLADSLVVNGACGTAANVASAYIPTANLCSAGTVGQVIAGTSSWAWSCTGTGGGTTDSCTAPFAAINGGGGVGAVQLQPTANNWVIDQANSGFQAMPAPAPAGVTFPSGAIKVRLTTGTAGTSATVVLRFSNIPAGAQLYKYGKETGAGDTNKWFPYPATIDRAAGTVIYTLTDGQKGDNDWLANGVIDDPVGAGGGVEGVPTLSQWAMLLMGGLMALGALLTLRRPVRRRLG